VWPWIFEGAYRVGSDTQESNNLESCGESLHVMLLSFQEERSFYKV